MISIIRRIIMSRAVVTLMTTSTCLLTSAVFLKADNNHAPNDKKCMEPGAATAVYPCNASMKSQLQGCAGIMLPGTMFYCDSDDPRAQECLDHTGSFCDGSSLEDTTCGVLRDCYKDTPVFVGIKWQECTAKYPKCKAGGGGTPP